jgi:DNA invertase Pin-like site-specific DNA recombinase
MTIRGYLRVSTEEQAREGVSLAAQRAALAARGAVAVYEDAGVSSSVALSRRPAGSRLVAELTRGDVLVVARLDRLFRSTVECLSSVAGWQAAGVEVVLLDVGLDTTTPMGRAVLTIMAALAQLERDQLRERTRQGMEQVRAEGRAVGRAPYGYRYSAEDVGASRVLVEDEAEQAAVGRMVQLRAAGLTLRAVVEALAGEGIRNRSGGSFAVSFVKKVLDGAGAGE